MRIFLSQLMLVSLLFLFAGCTPFGGGGDDNEESVPALNAGSEDGGEEGGDEGESEGGEQEGGDD